MKYVNIKFNKKKLFSLSDIRKANKILINSKNNNEKKEKIKYTSKVINECWAKISKSLV